MHSGTMLRIWGEFDEMDSKRRIILTHADDVKSENIELSEGMHVVIWDGDDEPEGILEFEDEMWRARIVPGTGRQRHRHAEEH